MKKNLIHIHNIHKNFQEKNLKIIRCCSIQSKQNILLVVFTNFTNLIAFKNIKSDFKKESYLGHDLFYRKMCI